jgi:hypothetical protein
MIEKTLNILFDALALTEATTDFIGKNAEAIYIPSGFDCPEECPMARAMTAYRACHHIEGETGNATIKQPGILFSNKTEIMSMVLKVNEARSEFQAAYSTLNKNSDYKDIAGRTLKKELESSFKTYPLITKTKPLNSKHISRKILCLNDVSHVGFYAEKKIRTERVSEKDLMEIIDGLSPERRSFYLAKLQSVNIDGLRYRYESGSFRYRINVKYNHGGRDNFAISTPVVIIGDRRPDIRTLAEAHNDHATRQDKTNFMAIIPELRLYAIS